MKKVFRELGLQLRNKTPKRRGKAKLRANRTTAIRSNDVSVMDFVHDQLTTGPQLRSECLNARWFLSLQDTCEKLETWRRHYNEERPHSATGNIPPIMLANSASETSPPDLSKGKTPGMSDPRLGSSAKSSQAQIPVGGKLGVTSPIC